MPSIFLKPKHQRSRSSKAQRRMNGIGHPIARKKAHLRTNTATSPESPYSCAFFRYMYIARFDLDYHYLSYFHAINRACNLSTVLVTGRRESNSLLQNIWRTLNRSIFCQSLISWGIVQWTWDGSHCRSELTDHIEVRDQVEAEKHVGVTVYLHIWSKLPLLLHLNSAQNHFISPHCWNFRLFREIFQRYLSII